MKKSFGSTMAPVTSLNRPVLAGRRIRFNRTDLDKMKRIAHAYGGKVQRRGCWPCGRAACAT